jgi:hypothetical protein
MATTVMCWRDNKAGKCSVKTPGQAAAREGSIDCQFHGSSSAM